MLVTKWLLSYGSKISTLAAHTNVVPILRARSGPRNTC